MPAEPEELWLADSDLPVKAQHIIDFTDSCSPNISDVAEGEHSQTVLGSCSICPQQVAPHRIRQFSLQA